VELPGAAQRVTFTVREIANYLTSAGFAPIYENAVPLTVDSVIVLTEYGGRNSWGELGSGMKWERPRLQILVRGAPFDEATPRANIEAISKKLSTIQNEDVDARTFYAMATPIQAPFKLAVDSLGRVSFVVNFEFEKNIS